MVILYSEEKTRTPTIFRMASQNKNSDVLTARRICSELRSGNRDAIMELYHQYHIYLAALARRRLYGNDLQQVENVLSDYWIELLNSKAICAYKGKASLRSYLTGILCRRIIDANRKIARGRDNGAKDDYSNNRYGETPDTQPSPEDSLLIKERNKLIHAALLHLAYASPRDAKLIQMHFYGMSYEEMARNELQDSDFGQNTLKKRTDAIKKQFTRAKTGSMAKFKQMVNRCLKINSLKYTELIN